MKMNKFLLFLLLLMFLLVGCTDPVIIRDPVAKNIKESGTYAYLVNQTTTNLTTAEQWYPVNGIYNNDPIKNFYVNTSIPAIVYKGEYPIYMEVQQHISISSSLSGSLVHIGISKNGIVETVHRMGNFLKTKNEPFAISQNEVLFIENGDYIQLIMSSDSNNNEVLVRHHTVSIQRFY